MRNISVLQPVQHRVSAVKRATSFRVSQDLAAWVVGIEVFGQLLGFQQQVDMSIRTGGRLIPTQRTRIILTVKRYRS
jgi:hypothetical protein